MNDDFMDNWPFWIQLPTMLIMVAFMVALMVSLVFAVVSAYGLVCFAAIYAFISGTFQTRVLILLGLILVALLDNKEKVKQ